MLVVVQEGGSKLRLWVKMHSFGGLGKLYVCKFVDHATSTVLHHGNNTCYTWLSRSVHVLDIFLQDTIIKINYYFVWSLISLLMEISMNNIAKQCLQPFLDMVPSLKNNWQETMPSASRLCQRFHEQTYHKKMYCVPFKMIHNPTEWTFKTKRWDIVQMVTNIMGHPVYNGQICAPGIQLIFNNSLLQEFHCYQKGPLEDFSPPPIPRK